MIEYKKHRVTVDDIVRTIGARPADGTAQHWAFREGVEDGYVGQPMKPKGNPYIAACYKDGHAVGVAFADFLGRLKVRPTRQMVEGLAEALREEGRQDGRVGKWNMPKTDEMIAAELAAYQEGYHEAAR